MTKEIFERAKEIEQKISSNDLEIKKLNAKASRFNDYIDWMDGRHKPIEHAGKTYKKVEIKFNMDARPTSIHIDDMFDMVEENKKDFLKFLIKSQSNYLEKIKTIEKENKILKEEFENLGNEEKTA
jgi:hypothetical protein